MINILNPFCYTGLCFCSWIWVFQQLKLQKSVYHCHLFLCGVTNKVMLNGQENGHAVILNLMLDATVTTLTSKVQFSAFCWYLLLDGLSLKQFGSIDFHRRGLLTHRFCARLSSAWIARSREVWQLAYNAGQWSLFHSKVVLLTSLVSRSSLCFPEFGGMVQFVRMIGRIDNLCERYHSMSRENNRKCLIRWDNDTLSRPPKNSKWSLKFCKQPRLPSALLKSTIARSSDTSQKRLFVQ